MGVWFCVSRATAVCFVVARDQEKKRFIELADRLARSRDPEEQARLKQALAVMTFGE